MAKNLRDNEEEIDDTEDDDEEQNWEDWKGEGEEDENYLDLELLCLFCDSKYSSSDELFKHCNSSHHFDFQSIKKTFSLDFYSCFKLLNYIRSQVAQNRCWNCEVTCESRQELQDHVHETSSFSGNTFPWDSDMYLRPYIQEDPLLYSFGEDDEDEFEKTADEDDPIRNIDSFEQICIDDAKDLETYASDFGTSMVNGMDGLASIPDINMASPLEDVEVNNNDAESVGSYDGMPNGLNSRISSAKVVDNQIMIVNKSYFGSYGSFSIHREMISDKVRTDAYRQAIVGNPSLLKSAVVMDLGCGTGILSLFAAQAGASTVIAVEASDKMASVASQIAKDNGLLWNVVPNGNNGHCSGVIKVIHGMVEDLDKFRHIQPHSVDVLLSEWMGYCLLYESMLGSVLVARDQWLRPGGAILPDIATMFVAGFGRGATSIPFWENVYGFNMSCVGKELVEDAARIPIVDVVDGHDMVTNTAVLQVFDLVTMKHEEVDFTATVELEPKLDNHTTNCTTDLEPITWCYGVVLWFETSFSSRFCKEMATILSTSPYTPPTHWSQTILTFREPIAMTSKKPVAESSSAVGTDACPAVKLNSRISIARSVKHRSIDISLEVAAIGFDGRKRNWPVLMFNL